MRRCRAALLSRNAPATAAPGSASQRGAGGDDPETGRAFAQAAELIADLLAVELLAGTPATAAVHLLQATRGLLDC